MWKTKLSVHSVLAVCALIVAPHVSATVATYSLLYSGSAAPSDGGPITSARDEGVTRLLSPSAALATFWDECKPRLIDGCGSFGSSPYTLTSLTSTLSPWDVFGTNVSLNPGVAGA